VQAELETPVSTDHGIESTTVASWTDSTLHHREPGIGFSGIRSKLNIA